MTPHSPQPPVLEGEHLSVQFAGKRRQAPLRAVDDVSLAIHRGETLGLVGESGCGKSTLGRALIGLRSLASGRVLVNGEPVDLRSKGQMHELRRRAQMVFQDPFGSLDPRMRVGAIIAEPLSAYRVLRGQPLTVRVHELMTMVGLAPDMAKRYPHEFSGGQRQRIAIARALALSPEFVVCDEPTSALDVSIQAQVLNLLVQLRDEHQLTLLFISHDLAVVRQISTRVAVMYLGRIVEVGERNAVFTSPAHPYTAALISAAPAPVVSHAPRRQRLILSGDVPSPLAPPSGCAFHTRCWLYEQLGSPEQCRTHTPPLQAVADQHVSSCHFPGDLGAHVVPQQIQAAPLPHPASGG